MPVRLRRSSVLIGGAALALVGAVSAAPSIAAPAGHGSWHFSGYAVPHLPDSVNGLACPTPKDCFAAGSNEMFWTTNATGGKNTWKHAALEPKAQPNVQGEVILDDVACGSAHLCVAVDDIGQALVSTHPTGGKKAWSIVGISDIEIEAVGCSSSGTCAAVDYNGGVFSTTHPAGAWTRGDVTVQTASGSDAGVSCAGNGLCAVVSGIGKIAVTTSPGSSKWHLTNVKGGRWQGIDCPTTNRCVAAGDDNVAVSHGAGGWKHSGLGQNFSPKVSCGSASSCFIVSNYYSSHPSANKHAWHKVNVPTNGSETAVSCPDPKHCYIGTATGEFLAGKR